MCDKNDNTHRPTSNGPRLTYVCDDCFGHYLKNTDFQLRCLAQEKQSNVSARPCNTCKNYETVFKTQAFIEEWTTLREVQDMVRNIDCQICYCGELLVNETLYSQQTCTNCKRTMCFFCNRTWDNSTMTNTKYTCKDSNCTYQQQLDYELQPLRHNNAIQVPDRRVCPNCFKAGGYGEA
ncbi:unnamed protein product, partial [Rotaria sordida]